MGTAYAWQMLHVAAITLSVKSVPTLLPGMAGNGVEILLAMVTILRAWYITTIAGETCYMEAIASFL